MFSIVIIVDGENKMKIRIPIPKMIKYTNNKKKKKDETLFILFFFFLLQKGTISKI